MAADPFGPERELAGRCLSGDPAAHNLLVERFTPVLAGAIRNTLRRLGLPEPEADPGELLQDVWVSVFIDDAAALRTFRWECPLPHFLASLAVGRCVDLLRRRDLWREARSRLGETALRKDLEAGNDPSRPIEEAELRDRLGKALDRLSDRERIALRMFYWEEVPAESIAGALKIRKDSVWSLLARARDHLRQGLHLLVLFL